MLTWETENSKHSKCSYTCENRRGTTGISLQNSKQCSRLYTRAILLGKCPKPLNDFREIGCAPAELNINLSSESESWIFGFTAFRQIRFCCISVDRHFPKVSAHILYTKLRHPRLYQAEFFFIYEEFDLYRSLTIPVFWHKTHLPSSFQVLSCILHSEGSISYRRLSTALRLTTSGYNYNRSSGTESQRYLHDSLQFACLLVHVQCSSLTSQLQVCVVPKSYLFRSPGYPPLADLKSPRRHTAP